MSPQKAVLILDDEPVAVGELAKRLRYYELDVEVVTHPRLCLERARKRRFDLFVLDINLGSNLPPDLPDGIAVARALRTEAATVNVPIVGITGNQRQRREEALAVGMVNFYLKPFEPDVVVPALLDLLESRSKAQQAVSGWLVQTAGEDWPIAELILAERTAQLRMHSNLVKGEGALAPRGSALRLALRLLQLGHLDQELFEGIGGRLYEGVLPAQINVGLQQCRLLAQLAQQPIRLLLRCEDRSWEDLPWEMCRYTGGTDGGHWLGGDPHFTCSRVGQGGGSPRTEEALAGPLKVLAVAACPLGAPQLDLRGELEDLHAALSPFAVKGGPGLEWRLLGPVEWTDLPRELEHAGEASPDQVKEQLARFQPHVVHFMAHGLRGQLLLEESGLLKAWSDFFVQLDLAGRGVRLLVLNGCLSGHPGENSDGLALAGLTAGVQAVVGHLYGISDGAARKFSRLLYEGLARGEAIDRAFQAARERVWSAELSAGRVFLPLLFVRDQFLRLRNPV
jgi:CheY-like chemotaxis protein